MKVAISSGSETGMFFRDEAGQQEVEDTVTVEKGNATARFYYKDTATGAPHIIIEWAQ